MSANILLFFKIEEKKTAKNDGFCNKIINNIYNYFNSKVALRAN